MKDILIENRYRIDEKIGRGGFSIVYAGTDLLSRQEVAIKIIQCQSDDDMWLSEPEAQVYKALSGGTGMPEFYWFGQEGGYDVFVQELLSASLRDLFKFCDRRFSLKTVLLVADQALSRLEYMHSKMYLHRDVKPDNFVMGRGRKGSTLYAVDFGLSIEVLDPHRQTPGGNFPLTGSIQYASRRAHDGIEALGYCLVEFLRGSLPWLEIINTKAQDIRELYKLIGEAKATFTAETLCDGLPGEFATYFEYVWGLKFNEKPNYRYLRKLFDGLFRRRGLKHDNVFDWTEKLFNEAKKNAVELK